MKLSNFYDVVRAHRKYFRKSCLQTKCVEVDSVLPATKCTSISFTVFGLFCICITLLYKLQNAAEKCIPDKCQQPNLMERLVLCCEDSYEIEIDMVYMPVTKVQVNSRRLYMYIHRRSATIC